MRKSLRYATVLFFLCLLSIAAFLGTDIATPLGVGGPLEDIRSFSGIVDDVDDLSRGDLTGGNGRSVESDDLVSIAGALPATSAALSVTPDGGQSFFVGANADGLSAELATAMDVDGESPGEVRPAASNGSAEVAAAGTDVDGTPTTLALHDEAAVVATASVREAQPEPEPEPRPTVVTHVIKAGETLWDIARLYDIDIDTIVAANEWVDANRLRIGDKLSILTVRGALHTVQRGESLWDISRTYGVSIDEIAATNGIADPARLQVQARLVIPGGQAQAAALRRDQVVSTDGRLIRNFEWPLRGRISSRYGPRWDRIHHGLDMAVPIGTPVRAAAGGVVSFSGVQTGYGNIVIIDHGNGVETRYAHLSRFAVSRGQRVQRGALIAYSGNTGVSTGPHLHFEIRLRGQSVDPERYLK